MKDLWCKDNQFLPASDISSLLRLTLTHHDNFLVSELACSAGVFFERAICSRKCHVETSRREEEMGRQYFDSEESDSYHINKACRTMILIERYNCSLRC